MGRSIAPGVPDATVGHSMPPVLAPGGAPSTVQLTDRLLSLSIMCRQPDQVVDYLTKHQDLPSILEDIGARCREQFGPAAELELELMVDPEWDDRSLTLLIRQDQYQAGVLVRLEAIAEPFQSRLESSSGNLVITTDFQRPREKHAV